jgi:hypothetical protein
MADFNTLMQEHQDLPEDQQKKAGQAIAGKMDIDVEEFLHKLLDLIENKTIDPTHPETFINTDVYDIMPQEWKGKTDLALLNIAAQITRIVDFYTSKETPNESPQLQTMIEGLWLMKQRIEEKYDVFKF